VIKERKRLSSIPDANETLVDKTSTTVRDKFQMPGILSDEIVLVVALGPHPVQSPQPWAGAQMYRSHALKRTGYHSSNAL
jgi:hypothetical protein